MVYTCPQEPGLVAKIYSRAPDAEKIAKLHWMLEQLSAHPDLAQWCTWPQELVYDAEGKCVGFRMARVLELRPIHEIYQPEQRKTVLPTAGWDFLVRTAANCARMFASLHRHDVLVGDVNERNIFVDSDATVHLVDCDSFQIRDGAKLYGTGVGVIDYTPPELQGADFRLVERTLEHDRFGLGVILFKLLLMGRHPFSGGATGDLGKAIAAYDWDYPQMAARLRHLVPWTTLPGPLRTAFQTTFTQLTRPDADLWVERLAAFEASLTTCRREPLHKVPQGLGTCPWCAIEQTSGYAYFSRPQTEWHSEWQSPLELLAPLDAELAELPPPREPTDWQAPRGTEAAIATARAMLQAERQPDLLSWYLTFGGALVALAGVAMALFHTQRGVIVAASGVAALLVARWLTDRRQLPWQEAQAQIHKHIESIREVESEWKGEALRFRDQDRRLRAWLADLRQQVQAVDAQRQAELNRLEGDQVPEALRAGLVRFELTSAAIPGVPVEKKRALAIRGVLTAADLDRTQLTTIPGLAPAQVDALVAWRHGLEAQMTGARTHGASMGQFAAIDANFQHIRENLLADMRQTLGSLRDAGHLANSRLAELEDHALRDAQALEARVEVARRQFVDA